jgi:predicted regulator of Ras-like GTPase activity (Roadblock/LC7/MglB family)
MVNVLQIGEVGTELSNLVSEVRDLHTQVVIVSEGKPLVAMVRYDYLANLLEAVASNDGFFSFEDVIDTHNKAHNTEVLLEDFTKV